MVVLRLKYTAWLYAFPDEAVEVGPKRPSFLWLFIPLLSAQRKH